MNSAAALLALDRSRKFGKTSFTRGETARLLSISVHRLRVLEEARRIHSEGEGRTTRQFSIEELERFVRSGVEPSSYQILTVTARARAAAQRENSIKAQSADGELAALVYEALEVFLPKTEIVLRHRIHPDVVDALELKYQKQLRDRDRTIPVAPCVSCGSSPARFCGDCAAARARR